MKPNPGSQEAIQQGCKCPVLDNRRGKGFVVNSEGEPEFWINEDCPLHGAKSSYPWTVGEKTGA
jgi:hypothetical protein